MAERAQVVIVGGGFGGVTCARMLEKLLPEDTAEIVLVNAENYMLFTPLLPEAAAGTLQPRHVGVPLRRVLGRTRVVVGEAEDVDLDNHTVTVQPPEGMQRILSWDRLVVAPGSISRKLPIPGLEEYAYGFKNLPQGVHIGNHVLRMLEIADAADDIAERHARLTFVVVVAGYAGTELIAELEVLVRRVLPHYARLRPEDVRWLLIDVAPAVLPELGEKLSRQALELLRSRGIEIRLNTSLKEVGEDWCRLSDGEFISMKTLVWTAGVVPDPLVGKIGLPTDARGRLVCDAYTKVQGRDDVFALGDAAAIPDPADPERFTPPTAQFALRQGKTTARNVAASLGVGTPHKFSFKGLGLLVNLGDFKGVGRVMGVPVTGLVGWLAARGYHLLAMPTIGRRLRVMLDWTLALGDRPDISELGSLGRVGPLATER